MSNFSVSMISTIISKENSSLKDINTAIKNLNLILQQEHVRKAHIKDELDIKFEEKSNKFLVKNLSEISYLEENLEQIETNIDSINSFSDILYKKKFIALQKNNEYTIEKKVDLKNPYSFN